MASVYWAILKPDRKKDGTWNVKIRITHKGKPAYISTPYFVSKDQLTRGLKIKDTFLLSKLDLIISDYRNRIVGIPDGALNAMTAIDLKNYLKENQEDYSYINIISFGEQVINEMRALGKDKSADNIRTVINTLKDFFKADSVNIRDINAKFLRKFEAYLRTDRVQKRMNQGKIRQVTRKGLSDSGIHGYMRDLRNLFRKAREAYNDEDTGSIRIPHYPFNKYKVGVPPLPVKRNMPIHIFKGIINIEAVAGSRMELARDMLKLSFYLCGMNAKDMYMQGKYRGGRLEYKRSKTKGKRRDEAFISINVPEEVAPLVRKYFGSLSKRYSSPHGLVVAIRKGCEDIEKAMPDIAEILPTNLGFYYARHTFANIARNVCRFSKDDVALALNHSGNTNMVTDAYLERSWDIVDEVQASVIKLLKSE